MAFDNSGFYLASTGYPQGNSQRFYTYKSDDPIATIKGSGYFNDAFPGLLVKDLIYVGSSDDVELLYVSSIDPDTTADLVVESTFELQPNSVTTDILVNGAVTEIKMADDSIDTRALIENSVTETALAGDSVSVEQLQDNAVTNIKLQDDSVGVDKLQAASVTAEAVAVGAITASKLGASSVTTDAIEDGACTQIKIGLDSIDSNRLMDNAVISSKLASDSVTAVALADSSVGTAALVNGSVTNDKLVSGMWRIKAVTSQAGNTTATITATVAGVTTGDRALAVGLEGMSTPSVSVHSTRCTTDTVTVTLSGALSPSHSLLIVVLSST